MILRASTTSREIPVAVFATIRLATGASWLFRAIFAGTGPCAWASARAGTPRRSIAHRRTRRKPRAAVPRDHIAFRSPNRRGVGGACRLDFFPMCLTPDLLQG